MTSVFDSRYRLLLAKLRKAREEASLTQTAVAKALRKPQTFVSKSELGERRVDFVEVEEFARIYGKPLGFFETSVPRHRTG
ncbi:MAG: helix-turn-helix transcriptional regulator [Planctomycetes bacterium]|nr:helix-turn-helix transcriptional regulator [Planctomycetota bacterium]